MKRIHSAFISILSWHILIACAPGMQVYTDYDRDYSMRDYATYSWAEQSEIEAKNNPLYYNELTDKRIKSAVNEQLAIKGYKLTSENPDLILHYHIVVEDRTEIQSDPYGYYGPYWMRTRTYSYQYKLGTLIIDLMDAQNKNLLWRGWAVSVLNQEYTPDKTEVNIRLAVTNILEKLPKPNP
jgi:hypothetical protein